VTPATTAPFITLDGVQVFSKVEVPSEALKAVDKGLWLQIDRMPAEWSRGRHPSEYRIEFVEPQAWNQDGSPALIAGGTQTTGTVRGINTDPAKDDMVILLPHQEAVGWRYLALESGQGAIVGGAWSESEHVAERWASIQLNDPEIFTKWVGPNDVHPHRP
jgi:uncharacterized protein (DUF736 family)